MSLVLSIKRFIALRTISVLSVVNNGQKSFPKGSQISFFNFMFSSLSLCLYVSLDVFGRFVLRTGFCVSYAGAV